MLVEDFNIVDGTDSYKLGHWPLYPQKTEYVFSYLESRNGAKFPYVVWDGLQIYLKRYLAGKVVTREKIEEAARDAAQHFGNDEVFNRAGWEYILEKYDGYLPVRIKAVPEGTIVPTGNVAMTIENTDPLCWWLTNHLETLLSMLWYPCTVATASREAKRTIDAYLTDTAESSAGLNFMLHDFGYRGASSVETAGIGGSAHLVNFMGSDTIQGIKYIRKYYNYEGMPAFSVVATEHSIMTAEGREGEIDVVRRILAGQPTGILSVVSDSYDIFNFVKNIIGGELKEEILARDGVFVVRPDSGDPVTVSLECVELLDEAFGSEVNAKGYKVLNPKVRVLWGDGINNDDVDSILDAIMCAGYSAENMVFGMGGGLLQKWNRDTQRFAFKSSAQCREGVWHDVYKDPIHGGKTSKKGRITLVKDADGNIKTIREEDMKDSDIELLGTVFENGRILKEYTWDEVRANAAL